ncbi:hypothetical protein GCM10010399_37020 [Dactylosporangium fulvum]
MRVCTRHTVLESALTAAARAETAATAKGISSREMLMRYP